MSVVNKLFCTAACVVLLAGCNNFTLFSGGSKGRNKGPVIPKGEKVVAVIGNSYISADDLNKDVEGYNALLAERKITEGRIDTREKKLDHLKNVMVPRYLLYQEALDEGVDRLPDVADALESYRVDSLGRYVLGEELKKAEVSDADVRAFYDSNKDKIKDPETRRVYEIVVPSESDARQIGAQLYQGADFSALARQYSRAPSAAQGGDLGDIPVPQDTDPRNLKMPLKYYEVAFGATMDSGSVSNMFRDDKGNYVILKVDNVKKSAVKPYSEVSKMLREYLTAQKQDEVMKGLLEKVKGRINVNVYEEKVD